MRPTERGAEAERSGISRRRDAARTEGNPVYLQRRGELVAAAVIDLVQAGYDEGSLRPGAPAWVVAYDVMGMVGWTNRWFNPAESPVTAEQIGDWFADNLLLGLRER